MRDVSCAALRDEPPERPDAHHPPDGEYGGCAAQESAGAQADELARVWNGPRSDVEVSGQTLNRSFEITIDSVGEKKISLGPLQRVELIASVI